MDLKINYESSIGDVSNDLRTVGLPDDIINVLSGNKLQRVNDFHVRCDTPPSRLHRHHRLHR